MGLFGSQRKKITDDKGSDLEEEISSSSQEDERTIQSSKRRKVQTAEGTKPLWIDAHAPKSVADVAVHAGKIKQVRSWLEELGRSRNLLVLTGPAGSGKTATVRALASEMKMDIIEWENGDEGSVGHFAQFLADSTRIQSRLFSSLTNVGSQVSSCLPHDDRAKLVLIEDLPNMLGSSVAAELRYQFQQTLLGYLEQRGPAVPVVIIFSDCETRDDQNIDSRYSTTSFNDRYTAESVLSNRILGHRLTTQIKFNRVAKTILNKALVKIATERHLLPPSYRGSSRRKSAVKPKWQLVIDGLALGEDIRSAINGLEFLSKSANLNSSLALLTSSGIRHNWLNLFHAVGKTVFNRPWADSENPQPRNMVDPLQLMSTVCPPLYILAVQENYLVTSPCMEDAASAISYLSESDLVMAGTRNQLGYGEAGEIAIRGVLASLEHCGPDHIKQAAAIAHHRTGPRTLTFPAFWKCMSRRKANLGSRPNLDRYASTPPQDSTNLSSSLTCNTDTYFTLDDFYTRIIKNRHKQRRRLGDGLRGSTLDEKSGEPQEMEMTSSPATPHDSDLDQEGDQDKTKLYLSEDDIEESDGA